MVEELRVSLFAQALGTAGPVSEKRVRAAIAAVTTAADAADARGDPSAIRGNPARGARTFRGTRLHP